MRPFRDMHPRPIDVLNRRHLLFRHRDRLAVDRGEHRIEDVAAVLATQLDRHLTNLARESDHAADHLRASSLVGHDVSEIGDHTGIWKCSPTRRSGRPVARANCDGSKVDVLVAKIVRGGHSASNSASSRPLRSGSSGTASQSRSASAAASDASAVIVIFARAASRTCSAMIPSATNPSAYPPIRARKPSRAAAEMS
jgi:hypothetical protein